MTLFTTFPVGVLRGGEDITYPWPGGDRVYTKHPVVACAGRASSCVMARRPDVFDREREKVVGQAFVSPLGDDYWRIAATPVKLVLPEVQRHLRRSDPVFEVVVFTPYDLRHTHMPVVKDGNPSMCEIVEMDPFPWIADEALEYAAVLKVLKAGEDRAHRGPV